MDIINMLGATVCIETKDLKQYHSDKKEFDTILWHI